MFTGLCPGEQGGDWFTPLEAGRLTLAELLRDRGYATGAFVANLHYTAWDSGLAQGFDWFEDHPADWMQVLRSSSYTQTELFTSLLDAQSVGDVVRALRRPNLWIIPQHIYDTSLADEIGRKFLRWHDRLGGRPYFAFLNLMDGHLPFPASPARRRRYPPLERGLADYEAAIGFMDAQIADVLTALERAGTLDRTIVIVTADHGELIGEHGLSGHAHNLYRNVLHVPLLVRYPDGVPAGVRVSAPVSLRDLAATVADLTGSDAAFPGSTLRRVWQGDTAARSQAFTEVRKQPNPLGNYPASRGNMQSLFDDSLHYIRNEGTGQEELYAYVTDTLESTNLAIGDRDGLRLRPWRDRLARLLRDRR